MFLILFVPLVIGVFSAAMQLMEFTQTTLKVKSLSTAVQKLQHQDLKQPEIQNKVRKTAEKVLDYVHPLPDADATKEDRKRVIAERVALELGSIQNLW